MKITDMPYWATKYKGQNKSIKYLGGERYGLYEVTSKYDKELGYSKSKQTFIGVITKDNGLVYKKQKINYEADYLEYGLSHFVYVNFKRQIQRSIHSYGDALLTEYLIKLIIIKFVFNSIDDDYMNMSYLFNDDDIKTVLDYRDKLSNKRIDDGANRIKRLLKEKVNDEKDYNLLLSCLRLITLRKGEEVRPFVNPTLKELLDKYEYKF